MCYFTQYYSIFSLYALVHYTMMWSGGNWKKEVCGTRETGCGIKGTALWDEDLWDGGQ